MNGHWTSSHPYGLHDLTEGGSFTFRVVADSKGYSIHANGLQVFWEHRLQTTNIKSVVINGGLCVSDCKSMQPCYT